MGSSTKWMPYNGNKKKGKPHMKRRDEFFSINRNGYNRVLTGRIEKKLVKAFFWMINDDVSTKTIWILVTFRNVILTRISFLCQIFNLFLGVYCLSSDF